MSRKTRQLWTLAELREVSRERSLLGPSGVGKTHLAISLGYLAVEAGYNVRFRTAQDLVDSLYASLADGNFKRELERYGKFDLLIIDELGCQRSVNSPGVRQIIHPSW